MEFCHVVPHALQAFETNAVGLHPDLELKLERSRRPGSLDAPHLRTLGCTVRSYNCASTMNELRAFLSMGAPLQNAVR